MWPRRPLFLALLFLAAAAALAAPNLPLPPLPPPSVQLDRTAPTVVPPGKDVVVTAAGAPTGPPVVLLWRLNFGPEAAAVPVSAPSAASAAGPGAFSATIPLASSAAKEGDLLRWRLKIGPNSYDPPEAAASPTNASAAAPPQQQQQDRARYLGALVSSSPTALTPAPRLLEPSPSSAANLDLLSSPAIPEIHWWHPNERAATSDLGAPGGALYLPAVLSSSTGAGQNQSSSAASARGTFHDAVHSERRGVTALAWAKPKIKFAPQDPHAAPFSVAYAPATGTRTLKLNSYHVELGDGPSMLREAVGLAVLAESGVPAPKTHYVRLFLNGRLLGLFGVVEDVDRGFLERRGLPSGVGAPLFESVSGELSNLRGDLPQSELASYWGKTGDPRDAADWRALDLFVKGLDGAGSPGDTGGSGGNGSSSSSSGPLLGRRLFVMDALDLPAVVNEAAAQTVLGNLDRCTKNFYVHVHSSTRQWRRIAWDVEASLGQDNGLGGKPGDLYAPLAKEQWNSPLYCDSEHPQDIDEATGKNLNTYFGSARGAAKSSSAPSSSLARPVGATSSSAGRRRRRRSLQQQQRILAEGNPLQAGGWPNPVGWDDPDAVPPGIGLVRLGAPPGAPPVPKRGSGAPYTYNHLTDALLDVPETRAMYLRRLRTLADAYYGGQQPRMARLVEAHWSKIAAAAKEDARLWARPDPERGVRQVLTEYVPIRTKQLLGTYAPGGVRPLLPSSAAAGGGNGLRLARFEAGGGGADGFVEIANDADFAGGAESAVDASGWTLRLADGSWSWRLPAGLVVPGGRSAFVARDVAAFRRRASSPRGGEGLIVVDGSSGAEGGALPGAAGRWELLNGEGAVVSTL